MIEVWLLESIYDGVLMEEIYIHIDGTNLWITDEGYKQEHLVNTDWTDTFWERLDMDDSEDMYTYLGVL